MGTTYDRSHMIREIFGVILAFLVFVMLSPSSPLPLHHRVVTFGIFQFNLGGPTAVFLALVTYAVFKYYLADMIAQWQLKEEPIDCIGTYFAIAGVLVAILAAFEFGPGLVVWIVHLQPFEWAYEILFS